MTTTTQSATTQALVEVKDLSVAYGKVEAVHRVSLALPAGQIVSVIGPNGAGKTTLLAAIMGQLPSSGTLCLDGRDIRPLDVESRVARGLSLVPEKRELFATMTVEDNLLMGAYTRMRQGHKDHQASLAEVFQRFPRLKERRAQWAGTLSGGERAMLVLGRALMGHPRVLMLDEPSLGLAPLIVREIFHIIADLRDAGVSVLLVEQNARAALQVSDYGYVLETGQVALEGPSHQLADDPAVMATYLGGRK
jgi:branched-chain amino acid transport system ATP-binding protein